MSGRETWSQEPGFREGPVLVSLRMPRADLPLAAHVLWFCTVLQEGSAVTASDSRKGYLHRETSLPVQPFQTLSPEPVSFLKLLCSWGQCGS